MESNYVAEHCLGIFRSAGAQFDAATALSAISGLAAIMAKGPVLLVIQAEAQPFRWRDDGTAPTTASGMNLAVYSSSAPIELRYTARNYQSLQFISTTAGGVLQVAVYSHIKEMG